MAELPLALNPVLWAAGRLSETESCLNMAEAFFLQRACELEPSLCTPTPAGLCVLAYLLVGDGCPFLKQSPGLLGGFWTYLLGSVLLTPLGALSRKSALLRTPGFIMMGQAMFPREFEK